MRRMRLPSELAEQRHPARRKQDFHGVVGDQHPRRMRLGQTVGKDQARLAGLFLGEHLLDFPGGGLVPRWRVGFDLGVLVADSSDSRPRSNPAICQGRPNPGLTAEG